MTNYLNISAYKFVSLPEASLPQLQQDLRELSIQLSIKGSVLLSVEGINLFMAGSRPQMEDFMKQLSSYSAFADMEFKRSTSDHLPFKRLRIRIKKEIIAMNQPQIHPEQKTGAYLEPAALKAWQEKHPDFLFLDTRNDYEFALGSFENALQLNIQNFNEFPAALANLPESYKDTPILTFCTGGIRCEKASAYMLEQGFKQVWQLKGGILNYFQQCGSEQYHGDCFVFDERHALNSDLKEVHYGI